MLKINDLLNDEKPEKNIVVFYNESGDIEKLDLISKWKRNIINNIELKIIDYIRG